MGEQKDTTLGKLDSEKAGKDKELEEARQAELNAQREEHNRRTGGS